MERWWIPHQNKLQNAAGNVLYKNERRGVVPRQVSLKRWFEELFRVNGRGKEVLGLFESTTKAICHWVHEKTIGEKVTDKRTACSNVPP